MLYPPIEDIEYIVFGGLVIMPLTLNHILTMNGNGVPRRNSTVISSFENRSKRLKEHLIVTNILPGSYVRSTDIIENGEIITHVNGYEVHNLDELIKVIGKIKIVNNEPYIVFKFKSKTILVMSVNKILEEEDELIKQYKYDMSPIINLLIETLENYDENNNNKTIKDIVTAEIEENNGPDIDVKIEPDIAVKINKNKYYLIK